MDEVENFHGCYLLCSTNVKYKGSTYIGYTVDPNRRINQHNKGLKCGGAWRTSNRGPWEMVLVVFGFPNSISALRFEWAWQHPQKSRRLHHISKKTRKENSLHYYLRILSEMLRTGPWNRLPLTIRKMNENYDLNFTSNCIPPLHMPVTSGPIKSCKVPKDNIHSSSLINQDVCSLCQREINVNEKKLLCLHPSCKSPSHIICLAKHFLGSTERLLPVIGSCPSCHQELLWGDLIRYIQGCYKNIEVL